MSKFHKDVTEGIRGLVAALSAFDKEIGEIENRRSRLMTEIKDSLDVGRALVEFASIAEEVTARVEWQKELSRAFTQLDTAVENTRATVTRFEKLAAKDEALLDKASKMFARIKPFKNDDPLLKKQRAAIEDFEKAIDFAESAFKSLGDLAGGKLAQALQSDSDLKRAFEEITKAVETSDDIKSAFQIMTRSAKAVRNGYEL